MIQVAVQLSQNGEFFSAFVYRFFCFYDILLCLNVCLLLCLRAGFYVPNFKVLFQVCCWFASILFVPCVGLFGLCVDYAFWNCLVAFPCLWVCVCM